MRLPKWLNNLLIVNLICFTIVALATTALMLYNRFFRYTFERVYDGTSRATHLIRDRGEEVGITAHAHRWMLRHLLDWPF